MYWVHVFNLFDAEFNAFRSPGIQRLSLATLCLTSLKDFNAFRSLVCWEFGSEFCCFSAQLAITEYAPRSSKSLGKEIVVPSATLYSWSYETSCKSCPELEQEVSLSIAFNTKCH
ncbi:hypothetical protein ACS0TY_028464 [Phlomoides rotata]